MNQLLNKKYNRLRVLKDEIVPCMYMLSYISEQGPRKFFVCMDMSMTRNLAVARKSVMMATSTAHSSTLVTQTVSQPNLVVIQPNLAVRWGNLAVSPPILSVISFGKLAKSLCKFAKYRDKLAKSR